MTRKIKNSNITPGALTSASLNDTGVTAGQYGSSTAIPVITTNAKGQLTAVTTASLPSNLATETYVTTAISNLIDSAPTALDTLNELAAALGDDASFAATITTALGTKLATADFASTFDTRLGTKSTSNLTEGTNLYFTDARARSSISATGSLGYNSTTGVISFTQGNTDTVTEGSSNLYFTIARARNSVSAGTGLSYNSSTGVFTNPVASGTTVASYTTTDASHYFTDNSTGFTFLEVTFTPKNANNKFLVMATVNGAAGDDASGVLQRYTNGSWAEPDELRGIASNVGFRGSFGDWSLTRATEDKQTLQYSAIYLDQPNAGGLVGYRVRVTAENTTGLWINRPTGTDGGYNTNSSRSTMVILEITP
jgi:hypothetical protein